MKWNNKKTPIHKEPGARKTINLSAFREKI